MLIFQYDEEWADFACIAKAGMNQGGICGGKDNKTHAPIGYRIQFNACFGLQRTDRGSKNNAAA